MGELKRRQRIGREYSNLQVNHGITLHQTQTQTYKFILGKIHPNLKSQLITSFTLKKKKTHYFLNQPPINSKILLLFILLFLYEYS